MADQAADIAPSSPEASKAAESKNAAQEPLMPAAPPAEPIRADAASPEFNQAALAKAAELGRQSGFQANATHLDLAYRVHRIIAVSGQGELAIPRVDREAVRRFVDEVFFATQFLDEDVHSAAKQRASRSNVPPPSSATGALITPETTDSGNDACRPNSGAGGESAIDPDVEAGRIAGELVKLHKAGAIKSEQDASFYANLIRRFGTSFTVRLGPVAANPRVPNGRTVPEPGKPYTPTAAQRVKVPRGLSRKQEAEFLARDLEEALACEPTPEDLGESVIDLTGGATSHGEVQQDGRNH